MNNVVLNNTYLKMIHSEPGKNVYHGELDMCNVLLAASVIHIHISSQVFQINL